MHIILIKLNSKIQNRSMTKIRFSFSYLKFHNSLTKHIYYKISQFDNYRRQGMKQEYRMRNKITLIW